MRATTTILLLLAAACGSLPAAPGSLREDPAQCGRRVVEARETLAGFATGVGLLCDVRPDDPALSSLCASRSLLDNALELSMRIKDPHCDALRDAIDAWDLGLRTVAATRRLVDTLQQIAEPPEE